MAYFLDKEREADMFGAYRRYQNYLWAHEAGFPPGAFALATAEWWHNANEHRCPHDGWLESLAVTESGGVNSENRITSIRIRLLAAYHDGFIELFYPQVFRYELNNPMCLKGAGDWRYDEFTLSPENHVVHEIEWRAWPGKEDARWIIEASDVEYQWIAK